MRGGLPTRSWRRLPGGIVWNRLAVSRLTWECISSIWFAQLEARLFQSMGVLIRSNRCGTHSMWQARSPTKSSATPTTHTSQRLKPKMAQLAAFMQAGPGTLRPRSAVQGRSFTLQKVNFTEVRSPTILESDQHWQNSTRNISHLSNVNGKFHLVSTTVLRSRNSTG